VDCWISSKFGTELYYVTGDMFQVKVRGQGHRVKGQGDSVK